VTKVKEYTGPLSFTIQSPPYILRQWLESGGEEKVHPETAIDTRRGGGPKEAWKIFFKKGASGAHSN